MVAALYQMRRADRPEAVEVDYDHVRFVMEIAGRWIMTFVKAVQHHKFGVLNVLDLEADARQPGHRS